MLLSRRALRKVISLSTFILFFGATIFFTRHALFSSIVLSSKTAAERKSIDHLWIWCPNIPSDFDDDHRTSAAQEFRAPSLTEKRVPRLSYRYSNWNSSPRLPRRFTPCEHQLMMRLLIIVERICREHNLTFAMSDGTLLGSWRHHDVIPWDDDLDLMMPIEHQLTFIEALEQLKDTVVQYYLIEYLPDHPPYVKVFFLYKPTLDYTTWTFPFVDVFFYFTNETHLWYSSHPKTSLELKHVFPLVMRPLGYLWLPAPREPALTFTFNAQKQCDSHWYDHRKETGQPYVQANCSDIVDVYPFGERNKTTASVEILKLNGTIIHTVLYSR